MPKAPFAGADNARQPLFDATEEHAKCWETGTSLADVYHGSRFINTKARQDWNNRRKTRGAAVYDLLMAWRYDRPLATARGVFATICRLLKEWHDEDKRLGRIGYMPPAAALRALGKEAE